MLLWNIRKEADLAARFRAAPEAVLDEYHITGPEREEMRTLDFRSLFDRGANPYLLYFCALEIGVDRTEYYAQLRGEKN